MATPEPMTVETERALDAEAPTSGLFSSDELVPGPRLPAPIGDDSLPPFTLDPFWRNLAVGTVTWEQGQAAEGPWRNLFTGRSLLLDSARTEGELFLLVRRAIGAELLAPPFSTRNLDLLERCASGETSVSLASHMRISQAAVSELLKRLVKKIGLRSRSELLWFCREHAGLGPPKTLRAARLRTFGGEIVVLVAAMRPAEVAIPLTHAERAILLAVLEGKSNPAIARSRKTSPSTVANQVMQLRHKLRVSTRYEIILRSREWAPSAPAPDRLPAAVARRFAERARHR